MNTVATPCDAASDQRLRVLRKGFTVARTLPGSYQPRCAIDNPDAALLDDASVPRRAARSARVLRGGIAVGAAGLVGLLAVVAPGIATSVAASNLPAGISSTVPSAEELRPGTTDAFVSRGSSERIETREVAADDVDAAAAERASTLGEVGELVAQTQTNVAAQSRTELLASTTSAIDAEAERLASIKFLWPTEGGITSAWGPRLHPILKYTRLHGGADIGGAVGAPIYAVADGVITKAANGYNGGSGNNVRIDHGVIDGEALETAYLHMSSIDVSVGQRVKKGQKIGGVGSTGLSTAPHLHFSVYVQGVNSDPAPYLKQ